MTVCWHPAVNTLCLNSADVVFLLSNSGSVDRYDFPSMLSFVSAAVADLSIDNDQVHLGLMTFATVQKSIFGLNTYRQKADVLSAINKAQYSAGVTDMANALAFLRTTMFGASSGRRSTVPSIAVLISNSNSINRTATLAQANLCRRAGIWILTLSVGTFMDQREMQEIASFPYVRNSLNVSSFKTINTYASIVRDAVCSSKL